VHPAPLGSNLFDKERAKASAPPASSRACAARVLGRRAAGACGRAPKALARRSAAVSHTHAWGVARQQAGEH
jgi:hypothetical protein